MSSAAVKARKAAKVLERRAASIERFFTMARYTKDADSAVVRCDDCGLLNVTSQGRSCFMCGGTVGTSVACGDSSCPGYEDDPDFPASICILEIGHDGMHRDGRCSWLKEA